jgi:CheY-like chemotaxis protein
MGAIRAGQGFRISFYNTIAREQDMIEPGRPIRILLVEDNPGDVRLTLEAFAESKLLNHIDVCNDGEDALDYLFCRGKHANTQSPDIILLDLNLPKKNGHEVLAEIKIDEELKTIPVVILTSSKADEDIIRAYDKYANCFITKPMDFNQFMNVIRSIEHFWLSVVSLPRLQHENASQNRSY